jgi:O-methyltransferase
MSALQYLNLLLLNGLAWVILSYFWSYWTYKQFKPYLWLEEVKHKKVTPLVVKLERKEKDRIRFYALWQQVERINRLEIQGSMAEVGVYKGETAKLIHHLAPHRKFILFDSFEGLPHQVIREDCDGTVRPQTVKFDDATPEEVATFIAGNDNLEIRKGIFPETAQGLESEVFALVHLDADLYQSTLDGLQFFYPRLSPGGSLVVHDYNHNWEGVKKAVDEFSHTVTEAFVEIPDMYGSVILIKNSIISSSYAHK